MFWTTDITPREASKMIRSSSMDELELWFKALPQEKTPHSFIDGLHSDEKLGEERFCKQICLLVWMASSFSQVPTAQQLEAALAFFYGKDSLLLARTGFGKTLLIVIAHLLQYPNKNYIVLIISPLKRP
jgi:superfamily II DNA/RNA helicase